MNTSPNAPQPAQLTPRQQAIVPIAAFTATGDLPSLRKALQEGLTAGLTVNETKEVLLQLYAYCGFPRSLYALTIFMQLLDEHRANGIEDVVGPDASPITSTESRYNRGKQMMETLSGKPEVGPLTGVSAFAPVSDVFLKEHLFADIFDRDVLSYQDREIATISALVSLGGVEPMLRGHLNFGLNTGLTEPQLQQLISLAEASVGHAKAEAARTIFAGVLAALPK